MSALFGMAAVYTHHDHWERSAKEVEPIAGPLTRMLNTMSPEAKKLAQKYTDPVLLLFGCYVVAAPSVQMEMLYREELGRIRAQRQQAPANPGPSNGRIEGEGEPPGEGASSFDPFFNSRLPHFYPRG